MEFDGKILKEKRLELNQSLEEVSEILKIRVTFLESIEENNLQQYEDDFYISHYIKNYCNYLNIKHEDFDISFRKTEHFEQLETQVKKLKTLQTSASKNKIKVKAREKNKSYIFEVMIVLVVISISYVVYSTINKKNINSNKVEEAKEPVIKNPVVEKPVVEKPVEVVPPVEIIKPTTTFLDVINGDYYRYKITNSEVIKVKVLINANTSYLSVLDSNKKELQGGVYSTGYIFENIFQTGPIILNVGAHQNAEVYVNDEKIIYQQQNAGRYQLELSKEN